ncbi:hypothetical protein [Pseudomonas sp. CCI2.4]|uniref:alpha/beta hydrolase n=1 Tax=Pseudomonas sp. CCI2.4 TaxID=3048617 RepID=UPI002B22524E|nr:hypothetical protein [Pseudomonas sp. CCI2.4]MEB0129739.1 hypothetical protein [Pseudomonas sp. CCI2.4]
MDQTDVIELVRELWHSTTPSKRRKLFQTVRKTIPKEHIILFQELSSHYFNHAIDAANLQILILVHGIHTNGSWQQEIEEQFSDIPSLRVKELGYELVTGPHFALFSRKGPIKKILNDIKIIKREEPHAQLSVIAHSFGTFIIAKIIEDNPEIQFEKIVICGSVIPRDFNWTKHAPFARNGDIVNDVGILDIWPVIANCFTLGYGASGNQGFRSALVIDRFFNYHHSDFFEQKNDHIRKYWKPIFEQGIVPKSDCKLPKTNVTVLWFCHSTKGKIIPFSLYVLVTAAILWAVGLIHH